MKSSIIFKFYKKTKKMFTEGSFYNHVFTVASGTVLAQIITVLFSPLITRIYGPEAFGIFGIFTSITLIIGPIVALTYPIAIVLPKKDEEAKRIIKLSTFIGLIVSLISLIFLLIFNVKILNIFQISEIGKLIFLVPLFLLFSIFFQIFDQWLIRKKFFTLKAKATVYQALIINISKVVAGLVFPIATSLIIMGTLSQAIYVILILLSMRGISKAVFSNRNINGLSFKDLAKKYEDFPKYRAPEMLINNITQSLPILFLTSFFGPASAGFYIIGRRVLSMPSQVVGKAVGDVFYPRINEAAINKGNITKLVIKATMYLCGVAIIPFGLIILFGPWLFSFIFGDEWVIAGEYARWMSVWIFFLFINNPSVRTLPVIHEQKFQLVFTITSLIIRFLMLLIGAFIFEDEVVAIALYSIFGGILNILLIYIIIIKCKRFDRENL